MLDMMRQSSGSSPAMILRTLPTRGAYVGNSHLNSSSVMDFNASPDDHVQEVLGAAYLDVKRLRDKRDKANNLSR
jgi:hypothetical protein